LLKSVEKDSQIIAGEIDSYFLKYGEIVRQMGTNSIYKDYLVLATEKKKKKGYEGFEEVVNGLKRIKETDPTLALAWLGSVSMSDLVANDPEYGSKEGYDITTRPWFIQMKNSEDSVVYAPPYVDAVIGAIIISIISPVYHEGKIIGNVGVDINLSKVESYVSGYKIGENGFSSLVTDKGFLIVHPSEDLDLNKSVEKMDKEISSLWEKMKGQNSGILEYERESQRRYLAFERLSSNDWIVACSVPKAEIYSQIQILWILSVFVMLFLAGVLVFLEVAITKGREFKSLKSLYLSLSETKDEVQKSHLELEAAYQQLSASDEALRLKYVEVEELSTKDVLTDIPNRRSFYELLKEQTDAGARGAVVLLDVDNFKEINDTMGHIFGDEVLKALAKRLSYIEEEGGYLFRFGGDEFFVLLKNADSREKVTKIVEGMLSNLKRKFVLDEEELYIKVSIGISMFPENGNSADELIMNADMAMYKVKNTGKNGYLFFEKSMNDEISTRVKTIKVLQDALDRDGFHLVYQPQFDAVTQEVCGFEALLRLSSGEYSPKEFIPVAEESGQIIDIGRWVVEEAVRQVSEWMQKGFHVPSVAINFSPQQLNDFGFVENLKELLANYEVPAHFIEIEITENVFLEDKEETIDFLNTLKVLGFKISLDDFGTGYSSLRYLSFLPLDKIKLDKFIIEKYLESGKDAVLHNIIALSHSLGLTVIAEGIEEESEYLKVREAACDCIQGFYFSKPLTAVEVEEKYML